VPRLEAVGQADDADGGVEHDAPAGEPRELRSLGLRAAGLAEALVTERADLVGADDERAVPVVRVHGEGLGDRQRLAARQPRGEGCGGLAGQARLVDLGAAPREGPAEAGEQFAAVTGPGREPERPLQQKQGLTPPIGFD